ncbi:hypothetical protein Trydic_g6354 [Trypoxylus dichotomus]
MGTPLRLLSPKLLTPKSPVSFGKFFESKSNEKRLTNLPKTLSYPISPQNLLGSKENGMRQTDIQIKISDFSSKEKLLIVKTPEKFEILENGLGEADFNILGRGSFGTVVTGIYKNEDVAVKVVKLRPNEELNEVKALNLIHKNIVQTIDVLINSNMNYAIVIMECLRTAKHLQNLLDNENIFLERGLILKYTLDITMGLSFCHKNNLVHMDLKPANILVCENGVCKLCDFGSCYNIETDSQKDYYHRGTIAYTAPEILLGEKPTKKCDVYSLGITLWQMLARKAPYGEIHHYEVIVYKVVKFELRPEFLQDSNDSLQNLYVKCWSTAPHERPNCSDIIAILSCHCD